MAARLASPSCLPRTASLAQHPTSRMCAGPKESLTRSLLSPCPAERVQQKRVQPGVFGLPASSGPKMPGQARRPEGQSGAPHMQAAGLEVRSFGTTLLVFLLYPYSPSSCRQQQNHEMHVKGLPKCIDWIGHRVQSLSQVHTFWAKLTSTGVCASKAVAGRMEGAAGGLVMAMLPTAVSCAAHQSSMSFWQCRQDWIHCGYAAGISRHTQAWYPYRPPAGRLHTAAFACVFTHGRATAHSVASQPSLLVRPSS